MSRRWFRPLDLLPIGAVVLAAALLWFWPGGTADAVEIRWEGETVATLPLDRDAEYVGHGVTVVVSDGAAYVRDADCPDRLCVKSGPLSDPGDTAICLPNRVTVTVTGQTADGVTY